MRMCIVLYGYLHDALEESVGKKGLEYLIHAISIVKLVHLFPQKPPYRL